MEMIEINPKEIFNITNTDITTKQEDLMLEEGRDKDFDSKTEIFLSCIDSGYAKCEICSETYHDEEIRQAEIDENIENVCIYCIDNLQENQLD